MRTLFIDLETTGLYPANGHVPLSLAFILDNGSEDDTERKSLLVNVRPTADEFAKADPGALDVNGFKSYDAFNGDDWVDPSEAKRAIVEWLLQHDVNSETVKYVGQNPAFDLRFLEAFMGAELHWLDFPFVPTDVIDIAKRVASEKGVKFQNFKGWGIARALGVEEEGKLHLAMGGAEAARRNYYAAMRKLEE